MYTRHPTKGSSTITILVAILILIGVGTGGWYVWHKNHSPTTPNHIGQMPMHTTIQPATTKPATDPSESGKYLVIREWGVRVALPANFYESVSYSLGKIIPDPDGNQIQSAKILIKSSALSAASTCSIMSIPSFGDTIDSGTQFIRSELTKPFNASRYRWTFKQDILTTGNYAYHLNYLTPDCAGATNAAKIEELQNALALLQSS